MKSYVWVTFAALTLMYYEMSGGADFTPQVPPATPMVASADVPDVVPDVVRETPVRGPAVQVAAAGIVQVAVLQENRIGTDTSQSGAGPVRPSLKTKAVVEEIIDRRTVLGSRVNMRLGPGTEFDVISTLDGGTELEVVRVNSVGWANVRSQSGLQGWMAARLLSDPQF